MKHTDMAAVVGAALLVATFSAQMTANALVPSVDLASGDALAHINAARAAMDDRAAARRFPNLAAAIRRNDCAVLAPADSRFAVRATAPCDIAPVVPMTVAQRAL